MTMNERALSLLGLCKRAGKLAAGEAQVLEALNDHKARLILVVEDSSPHVLRKIKAACGDQIPVLSIPATRGELGQALGWESCVAAAVQDMGFAVKLADLLAPATPEGAEQTAALHEKWEKMQRRKKEKPRKAKGVSRSK
jgi:ribosomal protein L7Ae-like RNA K-turn-binding protein